MVSPGSRYGQLDSDALGVEGDLLSEQDLVDNQDLMDLVTPEGVDQGWLLGELWKDLLRGEHAEAVLAEAEMRRVIEFNRRFEHGFIEGAGQTVARIPLSVYNHWVARYGHEFFRQKDSLEFFAARNPGFLIESRGKPQVVVDGFKQTSPVTAVDAATGVSGVSPRAEAKAPARATAPSPVKGRRGRWALPHDPVRTNTGPAAVRERHN